MPTLFACFNELRNVLKEALSLISSGHILECYIPLTISILVMKFADDVLSLFLNTDDSAKGLSTFPTAFEEIIVAYEEPSSLSS